MPQEKRPRLPGAVVDRQLAFVEIDHLEEPAGGRAQQQDAVEGAAVGGRDREPGEQGRGKEERVHAASCRAPALLATRLDTPRTRGPRALRCARAFVPLDGVVVVLSELITTPYKFDLLSRC